MAEASIIAWTRSTFNGWIGCTRISPGCQNCYAETDMDGRRGRVTWGPLPKGTRSRTSDDYWRQPFKWNREAAAAGERHNVFSASLSDWAEKWGGPILAGSLDPAKRLPLHRCRNDGCTANHGRMVFTADKCQFCSRKAEPCTMDDLRADLFEVIRRTPDLNWLLLTKRADRIASLLPADWGKGWGNVWLGVSIENNDWVHRADELRKVPAAVRFVSYEPALGPLDKLNLKGLDWIIYGGESGAGWRAEDKQWARDMHARCIKANVAFFHKQSAAPRTEMGIELDGKIIREYPTPRRLALPVVAEPPRKRSLGGLFS